jgi:stage II sporulation protein D
MNRWVLAAALVVAACARPEAIVPISPVSRAPDIRVGVALGAGSITIGGGSTLALASNDAGWVGEIPAGETARVDIVNGSLRVQLAASSLSPGLAVTVAPTESEAMVRVNGRDFRGTFLVSASTRGVSAINIVDLEQYLVGVVGVEMGIRTEAEIAAVEAQAIVSRTVALQRAGQWRERGYDLLATVADQVYSGTDRETDLASRAVSATRGQVITYLGRPIDAFFHSTCAGRTAEGTEVFAAADRPYLRSVSDLDSNGRAWCAISPRYRWRETWTGEALAQTLRQTLPLAGGSASLAGELRDIRVLDRTASGRARRVEFVGASNSLTVTGPAVRALLRIQDGGLLRSTDFTLQITRSGERIVQVTADGAGAGHGVGFCQWGAIGRARAGFSYGAILSAYFPGTDLMRTY